MRTLNSVEVSDELIRLGFALTVNNQHANGYEHPYLSERVFVKMSKTGAPVCKQPLLIHPDYAASNHWEAITALSPSQPNTGYRNTNMSGFPRVAGSDSKLAIALDIGTQSDFHQLLELLGLPAPGSALEPDTNESSGLDLKEFGLTDTEREALIKARIGQGGYREALLAYWGGCAITDCTVPVLLRASHIKPWRDASARERLDPYNGLLLTPNLDLAFDQGLISFNDHGHILISEALDPESAQALNITSHPNCACARSTRVIAATWPGIVTICLGSKHVHQLHHQIHSGHHAQRRGCRRRRPAHRPAGLAAVPQDLR